MSASQKLFYYGKKAFLVTFLFNKSWPQKVSLMHRQFHKHIDLVVVFINLGLAKWLRPQDAVRASAHFMSACLLYIYLYKFCRCKKNNALYTRLEDPQRTQSLGVQGGLCLFRLYVHCTVPYMLIMLKTINIRKNLETLQRAAWGSPNHPTVIYS